MASFLQGSLAKICMLSSSAPQVPHLPLILSSLIRSSYYYYFVRFTDVYLLFRKFSPASCSFLPLRPDCVSQNPILEHPQPMFLPQYNGPSFTLIHNVRKCISEHFVRYQIKRQNILEQKVVAIPRI